MTEKVRLTPLGISVGSDWPMLIFKDDKGDMVPIWLDPLDAGILISAAQKGRRPFGPHGGGLKILKSLDANVESVYIDEIKDQTQYASVTVVQNDKTVTVKVKAMEVMSLAAFAGCEFFATVDVIEKSRQMSLMLGWTLDQPFTPSKKEELH